ncbi:hypothetical protein HID58_093080 [Brassica napus]|uniref:Uncharacterized protein n=1 Tax=Brassica napus TaxID=3708 RepID=A0ABQ7XC91_BRANA|nr:hypothetical protein HID58_093080 [Brassica napus]
MGYMVTSVMSKDQWCIAAPMQRVCVSPVTPASVRCSDERVSLCQNCDWSGHNNDATSQHKRQSINCYSGCPSSEELASIWSFCLDLNFSSAGQSACEQEMGLMTIDEGTGEDKPGVQNVNLDQPGTSSALAKVMPMSFFIVFES